MNFLNSKKISGKSSEIIRKVKRNWRHSCSLSWSLSVEKDKVLTFPKSLLHNLLWFFLNKSKCSCLLKPDTENLMDLLTISNSTTAKMSNSLQINHKKGWNQLKAGHPTEETCQSNYHSVLTHQVCSIQVHF